MQIRLRVLHLIMGRFWLIIGIIVVVVLMGIFISVVVFRNVLELKQANSLIMKVSSKLKHTSTYQKKTAKIVFSATDGKQVTKFTPE